ncbi:hypothetical protein [Gordonibacter sp. Marseille-P4307]|nr:hypothetical protein [Gordonibacter sp. Marseille-P4307]
MTKITEYTYTMNPRKNVKSVANSAMPKAGFSGLRLYVKSLS